MKLYRAHLYEGRDGSQGYEWTTSRAEAERALRAFDKKNTTDMEDRRPTRIQCVEITPTKVGFLNALNEWASYPDNG